MKKFLIIAILLLAAFLRFYRIASIPPSLSWDEAAIGYDAYSIDQTGKDQWGVKFPIAFKSFGEFKYPFHIYATAFFVKIFGLSEFSVRVGSAFFGVINILLLYLILRKLFKDERVALISSFFLAISPWNIQFSRVSWETNYALFFFLLGILFFFWGLGKNRIFIIISFFLFSLTLFTYNALKIFTPLFLVVLCLIYFRDLVKNKKVFAFSVVVFGGFLLFNLLSPSLSGLSRFSQLTFSQDQVVSTSLYKILHVYKLGWLNVFVNQYTSHFSLKFLFLSGDPNPRHSIQTLGELLWFNILFIPLGLYYLIKKRDKVSLLFLAWFFLAPIPAAIAREAPHASRDMMTMGSWQVVSAFGLIALLDLNILKKSKIFWAVIPLIIVIPFYLYLRSYFGNYAINYSEAWQYGYKQVGEYISRNYNGYDKIYVTRKYGEPQIFLLFYLKYPPLKYQSDPNLVRKKVGDWIKVFSFDKFVFLDEGEMSDIYNKSKYSDQKILFVGTKEEFPSSANVLKEIKFLDGTEAFEIVVI